MSQRRPRLRDELITLAHGSGGKASRALVEGLFLEELGNPLLDPLGDSALLELNGSRLALSLSMRRSRPQSICERLMQSTWAVRQKMHSKRSTQTTEI